MMGAGAQLTTRERAVIDKLVEAWNLFLELPAEHPDDTLEMRLAIHAAQVLILQRPARREINS
jgi:hypothetical protein